MIADAFRTDKLAMLGRALEQMDKASGIFQVTGMEDRVGRLCQWMPALKRETARFAAVESRVSKRFEEAVSAAEKAPRQTADTIDHEVLGPWKESLERLQQARRFLPDEDQLTIDRLIDYGRMRSESWKSLSEGLREGNQAKLFHFEHTREEADRLAEHAWQSRE